MKRSCPRCLTVLMTAVGTTVLFYFLYAEPMVKSMLTNQPAPPVRLPSLVASTRRQVAVPPCKEKISMVNMTRFAQFPDRMKDFFRYRHCKAFPAVLDNPNKCGGAEASRNVFLLLVIKSAPQNFERREIIRRTWGVEAEYQGVSVRRLFITGVHSDQKETKRMNNLLQAENKDYKDILQWNFYDSFYNLTVKQVLFYTWLEENCPGTRFVFNGDDDVFVHTFNVVQYLLGMNGEQHLFVGQLNIGMPLVRDSWSKYYVPEEIIANESFVPYCGGGGLLMSGFTSRAIFRASQSIPLIPIDDAYLGICLEKAGLRPNNHEGVRNYGIQLPNVDSFDPCYYKDLLVVHRFVPYEMMIMWKAVQQPHLRCGKNHILQKLYRNI